ncbi:chitinase [Paenibacillus sp. GSMTC-2017]|uniref:glycoside hydrolase family 19 protein n=1 Tax=Paenibacillus sp. GSMTC-2017 TaxID=2794350 RepID=UPI0018D9958F|nr:glycoside hydrolase family 19 protein [Paenibacillus sp. GSMTC-2017]MBH5319608.1 chitinase [Paenibacillus sp. GSMTC-2017]
MKATLFSKGIIRFCIIVLTSILVLTSLEAVTIRNKVEANTPLTAPAWVSTQVYLTNHEAFYGGNVYRAKWWTQGDTPGVGAPSSSPWLLLGPGTASGGGNGGTNPTDLAVGESRVLTDAQITASWGGIDPQFSPSNAAAAVQAALPQTQYEQLFPMRIGTQAWHTFAASKTYYKPGQTDYYSYSNLIAAVTEVANIKYKLEYRQGATWNHRVFRLNKTTKTETLVYQNADFNASWNLSVPIISKTVDFGSFIKEGTAVNRKRELAAFLANISHETGGGWATAPGGELSWGLFWNEEISYINSTQIGYVASNTDFPAVAGKSYHGRGPIQLSWNYNYGLISGIIYGTKNTLLNNPELIVNDGKLGFMTAILFWMTPQPPKPSAHDVMVGNWTPNATEITKGLTPPGFGVTIMIINGNFEGNKDETDYRVGRRVGHYRDITTKMGVSITGEKVNTIGMSPF